MEIQLHRADSLRTPPIIDKNFRFGTAFSDYMFTMQYDEHLGGWQEGEIIPYGPIEFMPAAAGLHYGQIVWEGMKCYATNDGIQLFRPRDNFRRLNKSAARMCMPEIDVEYVLQALKELLRIEEEWVPKGKGTALYIRPIMIANDEFLGLHAAKRYLFYIILSPVGPYFKEGFKPIKIKVEETYVRAVEGGPGYAKTAGNYGSSLISGEDCLLEGYSQSLWLDGKERKYIEEAGTMNIMFVVNDVLITPTLDGTILAGITRDSVIQLCKAHGVKITERKITIDEIIGFIEDGSLQECFGTGTAAIIAPVGVIGYHGKNYVVNNLQVGPKATKLYETLLGIQYGTEADPNGWIETI